MARSIDRFVPVCLGIVVSIAGLTPTAEAKEPNPIVQLAKKMSQPVDYPGLDDSKATLVDALDMLAKKYGLSFDIREKAFEMDQLKDVARTPVAEVPIPKLTHVRLDKVLQMILARIPAPSGAVYVLRRDCIEITTGLFKTVEFYPHEGVFDPDTGEPINPLDESTNAETFRRLLPLVQVEFEKRPLREALQELAEATDWTVVLNEQAAEKAKPVTVTLVNVPLNTAVELLADMTGLTVIQRNKSLYVTTKENAAAMPKTRLERLSNQAAMGMAGGLGNFQGMAANGLQGVGGSVNQRPAPPTPLPASKQPSAAEHTKTAPADLAKMQAEIVKLQTEIAKLQAELARLQLKKSAAKKED